MSAAPTVGPRWVTSVIVEDADTLPMELAALGEHVAVCRSHRGRLFGLRCAADQWRDAIAGRVVTTLVVVVMLTALGFVAW
jgi:hypothetical protein